MLVSSDEMGISVTGGAGFPMTGETGIPITGVTGASIGMGVPEFRRHLLKHRIPIGRAGHVDDIAQACLYLASDASRYVTGSILAVDGGWTAS